MNTVQDQILAQIARSSRGKVFVSKDFLELGARTAVDQALSRLARDGGLMRLGRGLYAYPQINPRLNIPVPPSTDEIATALGRKTGARVVPSGAVAANRLGLSTQVPARPVYLTDGRSKVVRIGNFEIQLKHVSPKELPAGSPMTALVVQALRYLGREAIDDRVIDTLRHTLSAESLRELLRDARYTTDWIGDVIRRIASDHEAAHG